MWILDCQPCSCRFLIPLLFLLFTHILSQQIASLFFREHDATCQEIAKWQHVFIFASQFFSNEWLALARWGGHATFTPVAWRIHMREMTHSYVWHAPILSVTWIIRAWEGKMTDSPWLSPMYHIVWFMCVMCGGCVYMYISVCVRESERESECVCVCVRVRVCVCVCVCACVCVGMSIHRRWVQCDGSRGQAASTHY